MPDSIQDDTPDPNRKEVAHYLSDVAAQLAAMAQGAGLKDVAASLSEARDRCEAAIEDLS